MIKIQSFTGSLEREHLLGLARLRIEVFRDFPYLYDGHMEYEEEYLQTYISSPDSVVVVAFDGDKIVGASTGLPLEHDTENIRRPWQDKGFDVKKIFYYGESVLRKAYRGQGIGVRFFEHRERWARQLSRFDLLTFCGVVRPDDHPLRPPDYVPLDSFWRKRGFEKTKDIVCNISWKDIDEEYETDKPLHFWYKKINGKALG
ncbi:MAG: GNAT family N-acetyltransferase [Lewinellaceae bacterium]|nr:GNAT family N-acetyltransferase [Saprospiraceae bacterium]MCB9341016.1 GNAT family N-acetyltransferase [Lewinellaceae bacterium]